MNIPMKNDTVIGNRYQIVMASSQQTDGTITYFCQDKETSIPVVMAEFYPDYAFRQEDNRVDYTRLSDDDKAAFQEHFYWMKRFGVLPTVPTAYEMISENNTCYAVYEYISGVSVGKLKERNRRFTFDSVRRLLLALLQTNREMLRFGLCQPEFQVQDVMITREGEVKLKNFRPVKDSNASYRSVKSIAALGYFMITGKQPDSSSIIPRVASGSNLSRLAKYLKWVYNLPLGSITIEQMIAHAQMNFDVDISGNEGPTPAMQATDYEEIDSAPKKKLPLWSKFAIGGAVLLLLIALLVGLTINEKNTVDATDTDLVLWYTSNVTEEETKMEFTSKVDFLDATNKLYQNNTPLENVSKVSLKIEDKIAKNSGEGFTFTVLAGEEQISPDEQGLYTFEVTETIKVTVKNVYFKEDSFTNLLRNIPIFGNWLQKSSTYVFNCSPKSVAKLSSVTYSVDGGEAISIDVVEGIVQGSVPDKIPNTAKKITVTAIGEQDRFVSEYAPDQTISAAPEVGKETEKSVTIKVTDPEDEFATAEYIITFTVEAGEQPAQVHVPSLVGKTSDKAKSALKSAGLYHNVKTETTDNKKQDGVVIRSNPAEGQPVDPGSTIIIVVGEYKAPKQTKAPESSPKPSASPSPKPSASPSPEPSVSPSPEPSVSPSPKPSASPSPKPSASPAPEPSASSAPEPSASPASNPTGS